MEKYIGIYEKLIEKYGKNKQVMQTLEEMSELSKELLKNINRDKENRTDIILEMADVDIMLMQLCLIYNVSEDEMLGAIEYKMEKVKKNLGGIENDK